MTQHEGEHGARHVRLADLPQAEIGDHLWHPVRARSARRASASARTAPRAQVTCSSARTTRRGSARTATRSCTSSSRGRALFELDGRELELGPEELLLVDPETRRGARALVRRDQRPRDRRRSGSGGPAPYEHWYTALTADDPRAAAEIAAEGLAQFPDHGQLNYQLACFRALAGELDVAARHLRRAVASDERAWEWLEDDADLDALRSVPGAVPTRSRVGPIHVEQAGRARRTSCSCTQGSRMGGCGTASGSNGGRALDVTRLDLRGFGRSGSARRRVLARGRRARGARRLGIERAVLVGASFGGGVALDLAASQPDRVVGLVLAGAGPAGPRVVGGDRSVRRGRGRGDRGGRPRPRDRGERRLLAPRARPSRAGGDPRAAANAFELAGRRRGGRSPAHRRPDRATTGGRRPDARPHRRGRTTPTSTRSRTISPPTLPDARRETISGAGHLPSLEQPEAFDAAVLPFLDSLA